jgi:hypothetical protein
MFPFLSCNSTRRVLAVSDGSFKDQHGTAAIVVEGTVTGRRITTSIIVPGCPNIQCAYRSEAAGIGAALQLVNAMMKFYGIKSGVCTMGCNGQAALHQCFRKTTTTTVDIPQYDIIASARKEIQYATIQWKYKYIPGHQTGTLDREATLNIEMDLQCKSYWDTTKNKDQVWFQESWTVWTAGRKISSNMTKEIQEHCNVKRAERYWAKKVKSQIINVDWEGTASAMKSLPRKRQQWITKHSSGFCSVGRMAKRMGLRPTKRISLVLELV